MRIKIICGFLCACIWLMACMPPVRGEELELYATSAVLMDADSGRVLYGKNEDAVMAMASTTKIMTCILVLETVSQEDSLTVSAYAASMPKVKLYIQKGEQYRVGDLLRSLMLESHNDSAVALAEYVGKRFLSQELQEKDTAAYTAEESKMALAAFASMMNRKAAELGCVNTWFITPNGLDATELILQPDGTAVQKEHCTTARELAEILSYCVRKSPCREAFLEITRTADYSFSANGRSFSCNNHNAFLNMMDGALTGKTGFTNKAGYCYVGALERDGRTFVVALLACGWPNHKTYKWIDTRKLMQYGIDHYFYRSFLDADVAFDESRLNPLPVVNGQTARLGEQAYVKVRLAESKESILMPEKGEEGTQTSETNLEGLLMREDEKITVKYTLRESLTAPVSEGTEVGAVSYLVDNTVYRTENIVTADNVGAVDPEWCARQVLKRFLLP